MKNFRYIVFSSKEKGLTSKLSKILFLKKNWFESFLKIENNSENLLMLRLNDFIRTKACKDLVKKRELCFTRECGDLEDDVYFFFIITREIMRHSQRENLNQFNLEFESWFENYQQNIAVNNFFKNRKFNLVDVRGNVPKSEISKLDFWVRVVEFRFFLVSELKKSIFLLFIFMFFFYISIVYFIFMNCTVSYFVIFIIICFLLFFLITYFLIIKFFIIPKLKLRFKLFFVGNLLAIFKPKKLKLKSMFWLFIRFFFNFKRAKFFKTILAFEQDFIYEKIEFLNKKNFENKKNDIVKFFFFYFSCFFIFYFYIVNIFVFFFNSIIVELNFFSEIEYFF